MIIHICTMKQHDGSACCLVFSGKLYRGTKKYICKRTASKNTPEPTFPYIETTLKNIFRHSVNFKSLVSMVRETRGMQSCEICVYILSCHPVISIYVVLWVRSWQLYSQRETQILSTICSPCSIHFRRIKYPPFWPFVPSNTRGHVVLLSE